MLSAEPNVYAKVLAAAQDSNEQYPFEDLWPLCETAIATFGPERLMFGTDFPHVLQACPYDQALKWLDDMPFVDEEMRRLIGEQTVRRLLSFNDSAGGTV
jgi:L-fuconolactonase